MSPPTPAQFAATSSRPKRCTVCSTARRTEASSRTSVWTNSAGAPSRESAAQARRPASSPRAATATRAPPRANARAVARPMPEVPPVTNATRPERSYVIMTAPFLVKLRGVRAEAAPDEPDRLLGEATAALRAELLAQRVRGQHLVELGPELLEHDVGQPGADHRGDQAGRHLEARVGRAESAARDALREQGPELRDAGLADGPMQAADLRVGRRVRRRGGQAGE